MIVVSDTSPVLNLLRIGRMNLLAALYRQVIIPTSVYAELTDPRHAYASELAAIPWITVAAPHDRHRVLELCRDLDSGELTVPVNLREKPLRTRTALRLRQLSLSDR